MGKLVCELYRLVLRHVAAEEHFLNLRTLLLHIYDGVALNSLRNFQPDMNKELKEGEKRSKLAECGSARSSTRCSEVS